jgi:hypothetical protein
MGKVAYGIHSGDFCIKKEETPILKENKLEEESEK